MESDFCNNAPAGCYQQLAGLLLYQARIHQPLLFVKKIKFSIDKQESHPVLFFHGNKKG